MRRLVQLFAASQPTARRAVRTNMLDVMRSRGRVWGVLAQYEEARLAGTRCSGT